MFVDLDQNIYKQQSVDNLFVDGANYWDLAYVIYTSGTTGRPKGVMIEHRNVVSLIISDYLVVTKQDVFLFLSSPSFDAATFEIWTPLLTGSRLVIPVCGHDVVPNVALLSSLITIQNVSVLWLTKTLFEELYILDSGMFQGLRYLIVGGEQLSKTFMSRVLSAEHKLCILNGYGPTESTTFTCIYPMSGVITSTNVPIGLPIKNRRVYILDNNMRLVQTGEIGELYIGGDGVARGYLNQKELTQEKFVVNPFFIVDGDLSDGGRLYKTGDCCRYLIDGNIEYVERGDSQVKIRGYRVELGEIDSILSNISGVERSCVVNVTSPAGTHLIGYYKVDNTTCVSDSSLLLQMSMYLPDYMLPHKLIEVQSFPLTINGKVDKTLLPDIELGRVKHYVAPSSDSEMLVCKMWSDALNVNVGVDDDFFSLGGNSLVAIHIAHKMSQHLKTAVSVADIFCGRTIKSILPKLMHSGEYGSRIIKPYVDDAQSASMANMIFIHPGLAGSEVYHILTDKLKHDFYCVGIDNYNHYCLDMKISSLKKLAHKYAVLYTQRYQLRAPLYLLGWSLGGKIALEVAKCFEDMGCTNLYVILLDPDSGFWRSQRIIEEKKYIRCCN